MKRYDLIRHLIEKRQYKSYLEIGVLGGETFNALGPLDVKHSVDPNGQATFNMTSDEFFEKHCTQKYDIIFIDGLHLAEQVTKDIENSLTFLNPNGIIICHDCLPTAEYEQLREGISGKPWTGDVWKAFAALRAHRFDLKMRVVDTDYGCGLIQRGFDQTTLVTYHPLDGKDYDWTFFCQFRDKIMGVITVEQFLNGCW